MIKFGFLEYFVVVLLFCASSYLLTPILINLAKRFEIYDKPTQVHKTHQVPIPYLGGFAIALPLSFGVLCVSIYVPEFRVRIGEFLGMISAPLVMSIVGAIDDKKNLSAQSRFFAQLLASLFVILFFVSEDWLGNLSNSSNVNFLISLFWIVGITNSLNFFDNIDGGATGIAVIASLTIFILSLFNGQSAVATLSIALFGSSLGFLFWNQSPARIYLGDAGALFIGMLLAILLIRIDLENSNQFVSLITPLFVLALPIIDTSVAVLSRIKRRISPFEGGQDHLSHRLIRRGLDKEQSVLVLWCLSILFSIFALLLQFIPSHFIIPISGLGITSTLAIFIWFYSQSDF